MSANHTCEEYEGYCCQCHVEELEDQQDKDKARIAELEAERDTLAAQVEALPCYVARAGEGTYECRVDNLCPACAARTGSAAARYLAADKLAQKLELNRAWVVKEGHLTMLAAMDEYRRACGEAT